MDLLKAWQWPFPTSKPFELSEEANKDQSEAACYGTRIPPIAPSEGSKRDVDKTSPVQPSPAYTERKTPHPFRPSNILRRTSIAKQHSALVGRFTVRRRHPAHSNNKQPAVPTPQSQFGEEGGGSVKLRARTGTGSQSTEATVY